MPTSTEPTDDFLGRDRELDALLERWASARQGRPQLIVLSGVTGRGKTRLLQELYRRLALSDLAEETYWPPKLESKGAAMGLVPTLSEGTTSEPSWLWLALRCADPFARNSLTHTYSPLDGLRLQIRRHLSAFYTMLSRRERRGQHGRVALGVLATVAFPGAGGAVELGSYLLGALNSGNSAREALVKLQAGMGARQERQDTPALDEGARDVAETLLETLRAVCGRARGGRGLELPVLLVWDDAHWAEPDLVASIRLVLAQAIEHQWPLMIVATCWPEALEGCHDPSGASGSLSEVVTWMSQAPAAPHNAGGAEVISLPSLSPRQQDILVQQYLPEISACARSVLVERASGDLELLADYCTELEYGGGWLTASGELAASIDTLYTLPSLKHEMARTLLRTAGREVAELLAIGSVQGLRFFGYLLRPMVADRFTPDEYTGLLAKVDRALRLCDVRPHAILERDIEFRTRILYELSCETFERLSDQRGLLELLASELSRIICSGELDKLSAVDRLAVQEDLLAVAGRLQLWESASWRPLLLPVGLSVARLELMLGRSERARTTAEQVRSHAQQGSDLSQRALDILCAQAHVSGQPEREDALLAEWMSIAAEERIPQAAARQARRDVRAGSADRAVEVLRSASKVARPPAWLVIELARARCYAGDAKEALVQLEGISSGAASFAPSLRAAYDHARYMGMHDLDLNESAAELSMECLVRFREIGALEEEILCHVNFGDALWGLGRTQEARTVLEETEGVAEEAGLPHALNLARLCLANVVSDSDVERAVALYDCAIRDADGCQWTWDALYGRIYRTLLTSEQARKGGGTLRLHAQEARRRGYRHLAALASGLSSVADTESGAQPDGATIRGCMTAPFATARAHAAAAILLCDEDERWSLASAKETLTRTLSEAEGMKGRPAFVKRASLVAAKS